MGAVRALASECCAGELRIFVQLRCSSAPHGAPAAAGDTGIDVVVVHPCSGVVVCDWRNQLSSSILICRLFTDNSELFRDRNANLLAGADGACDILRTVALVPIRRIDVDGRRIIGGSNMACGASGQYLGHLSNCP